MHNSLAIAGVVILEMIRRKDVYVLFFLTALVTLVLGSVNLFGDPHIARYLKEVCLLLIWVSSLVIAIATAARQISSERESRTIFPLLAKPVTRGQVMLGKFLGCWAACVLSLVVFYAFFCVISGTREEHWPLASYFQAFLLHAIFCGIVVALTLLGSVVFSAPSANSTICFVIVTGILLLGRHLHKLALQTGGVGGWALDLSYFSIPHLEWYDMRDLIIHNWPRLDWTILLQDAAYGAVYGSIFLAAACWRFRRMALN